MKGARMTIRGTAAFTNEKRLAFIKRFKLTEVAQCNLSVLLVYAREQGHNEGFAQCAANVKNYLAETTPTGIPYNNAESDDFDDYP